MKLIIYYKFQSYLNEFKLKKFYIYENENLIIFNMNNFI